MDGHATLDFLKIAMRGFGRPPHELALEERRALERAATRRFSEDPARSVDVQTTFGGRLADRVARFGGSWGFISIFMVFLIFWAILNTEILGKTAFDPYPYIFLNLMLSMLAALQAPVIMMSQNRLATKDRQMAAHDYEVNLKAEIEIMALHEKLDSIRSEQLLKLMEKQQETIELMTSALDRLTAVHGRICGPS
ncbi:MAG: DUF1003 domain-containing protein [Pseudomonadota bacterium]